MAQNYGRSKRDRELAKKQKRQEKADRKARRQAGTPEPEAEGPGTPSDATPPTGPHDSGSHSPSGS